MLHHPIINSSSYTISSNLHNSLKLWRRSNARIPPRPKQIVEEVDEAQSCKHPIEQIQPILIQIVIAQPPRRPVHDRHEHRADEEPERVGAVGDGRERSMHPSQRLLVEELDQPHRREHLRHPEYQELGRDPEDWQRSYGSGPPLPLHQRGGDHGEGGGEEAGPDAAEGADAGGVARESTGEGDEEGVVEGDDEDEHEVRDGLEGGGRDVEGFGEVSVHGGALLDWEGLELGEDGVEDYGACEYWHDWDQYFHLLHLFHCAEGPSAFFLAVFALQLDTCLVQESAKKNKNK